MRQIHCPAKNREVKPNPEVTNCLTVLRFVAPITKSDVPFDGFQASVGRQPHESSETEKTLTRKYERLMGLTPHARQKARPIAEWGIALTSRAKFRIVSTGFDVIKL
jgi:hypothetical protein